MKNLAIVFSLFLLAVSFSNCKNKPVLPDPCAAVVCENGGTCNSGKCNCPDGYSGERCEAYYTTNLAGTFSSQNFTCTQLPIPGGEAEIKVDPQNPNRLLLPNGLVAEMNGMTFTVPPKAQFGMSVWGDGYFKDNDHFFLRLNIGSLATGILSTCTGEYSRVQ